MCELNDDGTTAALFIQHVVIKQRKACILIGHSLSCGFGSAGLAMTGRDLPQTMVSGREFARSTQDLKLLCYVQ